ncbi:MAG: HAMP domain-containing histidine kinase [Bacteroidales bacterium]|nr:HAMP domain-containing histidine kinase [Bacteroidales bacterium]
MKIPQLKLKNQLALFNALSKALIITLLVIIVPWIVSEISIRETDDVLIQKLDQVIELVDSLGIDNYIDMESEFKTFGSYNILKEEYISIEQIENDTLYDVIEFSQRIIENELVDYRVLSYSIRENGNNYLIEIGKSISTIYHFEQNLKRFTFLFLLIVITLTLILDLSFIQYLLIPLDKIIKKLKSTNHPSSFDYSAVKTSTSDFIYLDETIHSLMRKIVEAFNDERDYISNVSHELLTPVSIIQSKLDNILNESSLPEEDMIKIFESKKTLRRLTNLVRTLLMMSRIENEEYILTEKVNLTNTLQNVLDEIEDKIVAKNLELKLKFKAKSFVFPGNDNLLFTLFYNFINNAIRYTDKGHISIETMKENNQFLIKISDTGIGIHKDKIPHIFSRFKNSSETKDSYGLGLALSKKICDYHNIEVEVVSELNKGSVFTLKFPN